MLPALAQALEDPRPMTDEEQRLACFEMFNTFWQDAVRPRHPVRHHRHHVDFRRAVRAGRGPWPGDDRRVRA